MSMLENPRPVILVVDDDASLRELLKLQLAAEGYDVRLADDAIVAGRALMQEPADVIVVDVALPYIDGIDFVAALKADLTLPEVPVIFIAGNAAVVDRARALRAPCLKKPFSVEQLLEALRREFEARPPRRRARLDSLSPGT